MGKGGKTVPNQYLITANNGNLIFFQSYDTIIACKEFSCDEVRIFLDHGWKNSNTTNRYRCIFLQEDSKGTEKKIKSGEYAVTDLNTNFTKITQL